MDEEITQVYEQLSDLVEPTRTMSPKQLAELLALVDAYEIDVEYVNC